MFSVNINFLRLPGNYLFSTIAGKVNEYKQANPDKSLISLGIGDVTRPLPPAVISALHSAVDEMADASTFKGYAPDGGYAFLREAISKKDYAPKGVDISPDEIFVGDGAKSDSGNIQEIFSPNAKIAVTDPVYPVYVDSNAIAGRVGFFDEIEEKWDNLIYMPCTADNCFAPQLPGDKPDVIYLCFPNNPTGSTIPKSELQEWVDYANTIGALIIYDAAYEAYISSENVAHSIFECEGAKTCAIEIRSFSKNAGFTGTRLGFTVIPKELEYNGVKLRDLWARRQGTKFNGAPYIIQKAGEAVYSDQGQKEVRELVEYYMENARLIRETLDGMGYTVSGGIDAPYIWMKTPEGVDSWGFFDRLLTEANVVGTPGSGFGPSGEGYFRLTAFGTHENTKEALERIKRL